MMVINNIYNIGDIVYLKTDKDQLPRIVFAFNVSQEGITYKLCTGTITSEHFGFEISSEVNSLFQVT